MRRLLIGLVAFAALAGLLIVLPVVSHPSPPPRPVHTATHQLDLGSFEAPATDATVQQGLTKPIAGVPDSAPTLVVRRLDVAPFSLVGVTWADDPQVTDTLVQVRVQDDSGDWGSWTEVGTETIDRDASGGSSGEPTRGGTSPLWTGRSTGVEVQLVTRSGAAPKDVQLDLVDPGTSPADALLGAPAISDTAHAASSMPAVYSRAQWGADESIRTWDPQYAPTIKAATVHHTADTNDYTAADVPAMLRSIYRYHAVSLGWGDIGYNVLVDKFGRLWEGRYGGLSSTVIGAHAGGFNTSTFGVSMMGNYDIAPTTDAMIQSVAAIIAWKFSLYGVDPRGTTQLTSSGGGTSKYAAGVKVTLPTIFGHREVGSTVCPGQYGYAQLGNIRALAASMIGGFVSPIDEYYNANGTSAGLGNPGGLQQGSSDGVGLYRQYELGTVFWSPSSGAHATSGAILNLFNATGGVKGALRYPTGEMACGLVRDGCRQDFQRGTVAASPATGTRFTNGAIGSAWAGAGGESGDLGYPSSDMACGMAQDGCGQQFEGGSVYWTVASGAHPVSTGPIRDYWMAQGWERGSLGYATSDRVCTADASACRQDFQGETVAWSQAAGTQTTSGSLRDVWLKQGGATGALGSPKSAMVCGLAGGACRQEFTGGAGYASASGTWTLTGPIGAAWLAGGAEAGALGAPAGNTVCNDAATICRQDFARETASWTSSTGVQTTSGSIRDVWLKQGGGTGALGSPKSAMVCGLAGGACRQEFTSSAVYATATATRVVPGAMGASWVAGGAEAGPLGAPAGDAVCNDAATICRQDFARETMTWTPATGVQTTSGAVRTLWVREGAGTGWLGSPSAAMVCGLAADGCKQQFQRGSIYWSAATGARAINGAIATTWLGEGAESGYLKYPSTDMGCGMVRDGCGQQFQGGSIYWSPATGAQATSGAIRNYWMAQGWERGALGFPAAPMTCTEPDGGCRQRFEGGTVVWSPVGNRITVTG